MDETGYDLYVDIARVYSDPKEEVSLDVLCKQMARVLDWMPGILLRADGYVTDFYRKD